MQYLAKILSLVFLALSSIVLIGLQAYFIGWIFLLLGALILIFADKSFKKDILLIYFSIGLLGISPISTDISYQHGAIMGTFLALTILIPYLVSKYVNKNNHVQFRFHHGRNWYTSEILYIVLTACITYLFFPIMLYQTGSYLNWNVEGGISNMIRLFIGTNALGIWDELFFISTVLGLLRRHLSFKMANLLQSILFTSFLYELGFRGWGFLIIFLFALLQGYIFKKTDSLFYVITIHLVADLILFLALIYLHHPTWMPIFITK